MKPVWFLAACGFAFAQPGPIHIDAHHALERLQTGNRQYLEGRFDTAHVAAAARAAVSGGQHPIATVLSCSDSRVPPELLFNQGLGDLFVVRVAGAVPDQAVLGSIEYAAEHLHVPLLVVMGHIACGAVKSAMESAPPLTPDPAHANLERILSAIRPGLKHASGGGDRWANAVHASIGQNIADTLRLSPLVKEFVGEGRVMLVGALYDIESGKVDFFNPVAVR